MKTITKTFKEKYYRYNAGEFLPIYLEGQLTNKREFHMYKLKRALVRADRAWMSFVERAHAK